MTLLRRHIALAVPAVLATLCLAPEARAQTITRTVDYEVKKGDTCWAIAKKLYGDPWKYKSIRTKAKTCPDKIVPGQILKLPHPEEVAKLPDARVDRARGDVTARSPKNDWSDADAGLDLWRAWKVNSGKSSDARIGFTANGGRLELRENTLVVIYGPSEARVGASTRATASAELERGTLRARLGELAGEEVSVKTPGASADMGGGGDVLVAVDVRGTTRVSNHDGGKVEVSSRRKKKRKKKPKKIKVPVNMGSKIEKGKEPTPPRPLPDAPTWAAQIGLDAMSFQGVLSGAEANWEPVQGASSYALSITSDEAGSEPVDRLSIPGQAQRATFKGLPTGEYWLRASTIDGDAFESRPSEPLRLTVHELALEGSGADGAAPRLGDVIVAPEGVTCSSGGDYSNRTLIDRAGKLTVSCKAGERTVAMAPVIVDALELSVPSNADSSRTITITAGESTSHEILLSYPVTQMDAVGQGVEVVSLEPADASNTRWLLTVASADPKTGQVALSTKGAPLATFPVIARVGEARAVQAQPWRVGAHGGWAGITGNAEAIDGLGTLTWEAGAALSAGIAGGLSLTLDLGALGLGDTVAFAPQVGAQIALPFAVQPLAGVNVGAAMTFADGVALAPLVSGYIGLRAPLTDSLSVRAQADGRGVFDDVGNPSRHLGASLWMEWSLD